MLILSSHKNFSHFRIEATYKFLKNMGKNIKYNEVKEILNCLIFVKISRGRERVTKSKN